jgi:N-acetylglucosamine kinase-like BadF-type ATPase
MNKIHQQNYGFQKLPIIKLLITQYNESKYITCKLIAETRKIIEGGHDGPASITDLLNLILQVVTNIDTSVNRMEKNMDSRINELHQSMLSVSSRVRSLETQTTELNKKLLECETSCQG